MTNQTLHIRRHIADIVHLDRYRDQTLFLRSQYTCDIMRGATATTWALFAGAVLMLAVVAFAPRNTVMAEVASGSNQVTIAARTR